MLIILPSLNLFSDLILFTEQMTCKYAMMLPAFLLIIIHFIVLHPILKDKYQRVAPFIKYVFLALIHPIDAYQLYKSQGGIINSSGGRKNEG